MCCVLCVVCCVLCVVCCVLLCVQEAVVLGCPPWAHKYDISYYGLVLGRYLYRSNRYIHNHLKKLLLQQFTNSKYEMYT